MQFADDLENRPGRGEPKVMAVMADWSAENPEISLGDQVVFISHRAVEDELQGLPARARYKVHSASLGDHTKLVTLIIYVQGEADLGLHETVVTTGPRGAGDVLARGFGHRDQPMILVFKLAAERPALASA